MSRRSDILDALVAVFGGSSVVVRASVQSSYDELKAETNSRLTGVFTDDIEDVSKEGYQRYDCILPVTVERIEAYENSGAWIARQAARAAQAETIFEALLTTFSAADPTLSGAADYVDYAGGNVLLPDEASHVVGAFVVLRARYQFSISDPDSL